MTFLQSTHTLTMRRFGPLISGKSCQRLTLACQRMIRLPETNRQIPVDPPVPAGDGRQLAPTLKCLMRPFHDEGVHHGQKVT